jgi:O-antigen/teichoic acid export membrane protein
VGNGILLKGVLATVVYGAALLVGGVAGYGGEKLLYIAISGAGFFLAPLTLYTAAFFSTLQLRLPSLIEIACRIVNVVLVVLVILAGKGLAVIFAVIVLAGALEAFAKTYYARKHFRPNLRIDFARWKYLVKEAWPLALVVIPTLLIQRVDQIMLEKISGDAVLGYYSAAVRLTEAFLILPVAAISSLFPLLSKTYEQEGEAFTRTSRAGFRYLSILGVAISCLLLPLAGHAVTTLFGRPFAPSEGPAVVLGGAMIFLFGGFLLGSQFVIMGRQKALGVLISIAAVLNVVLNGVWIPAHGAIGASLATLVSYGFAMVAAACYPPMVACGRQYLLSGLRASLAGALSLGSTYLVFADHPVVWAVTFLVFYTLLLAATGTFHREDWQLAKRILSRSP